MTVERLLGEAMEHHRLGRLDEAARCYSAILALDPEHFDGLHLLGVVKYQRGEHPEALRLIQRALARAVGGPAEPLAWSNLGLIQGMLGRPDQAIQSYHRALALNPNLIEALNNIGNALHSFGRFDEAIPYLNRAVATQPDFPDALSNRSATLRALGRAEEALADADRAIALRPGFVQAHYNRGLALVVLSRTTEAQASFDAAVQCNPDSLAARLAACITELPVIYPDEAAIARHRADYERRLVDLSDHVRDAATELEIADSLGMVQPFYLPYQGGNDRELQARYGSLFCRAIARRYTPADLPPPPAPGERIRVGIVSGYFWHHSNWKIPIRGWVSQLDRKKFQLFGYYTGQKSDRESAAAETFFDRFVKGPQSFERWREEILSDRLHVLIYPEVGMDPIVPHLAAQRLARVQANSWGHPETSGFPTLDYYLSSDLMEPENGQDCYTERLVRLPNLSIYIEPIVGNDAALPTRAELGLRKGSTVYWCCQSLYKYLPQYDQVFPRIAREVGDCQFAFIQHEAGSPASDLFLGRLARAFAAEGLDADRHCVILPRMTWGRFMHSMAHADAFLDSIGWSGCNSTLESLPQNVPIVTLTGDLMRARHTTAILTMMGVTETITSSLDDYIKTAVRLGRDAAFRKRIKSAIATNKHRVFHDKAAIAGLEDFLERAARGSYP